MLLYFYNYTNHNNFQKLYFYNDFYNNYIKIIFLLLLLCSDKHGLRSSLTLKEIKK